MKNAVGNTYTHTKKKGNWNILLIETTIVTSSWSPSIISFCWVSLNQAKKLHSQTYSWKWLRTYICKHKKEKRIEGCAPFLLGIFWYVLLHSLSIYIHTHTFESNKTWSKSQRAHALWNQRFPHYVEMLVMIVALNENFFLFNWKTPVMYKCNCRKKEFLVFGDERSPT